MKHLINKIRTEVLENERKVQSLLGSLKRFAGYIENSLDTTVEIVDKILGKELKFEYKGVKFLVSYNCYYSDYNEEINCSYNISHRIDYTYYNMHHRDITIRPLHSEFQRIEEDLILLIDKKTRQSA